MDTEILSAVQHRPLLGDTEDTGYNDQNKKKNHALAEVSTVDFTLMTTRPIAVSHSVYGMNLQFSAIIFF
jgi:hypothetical protein